MFVVVVARASVSLRCNKREIQREKKNAIHSNDNPISASCFPIVKHQRQAAVGKERKPNEKKNIIH